MPVQVADRPAGESAGLDGLASGSHVCWVVDSTTQFDALAAECLAEGLRRNEKLLRFGPQERLADLPAEPPAIARDPSVWVLGGGRFDPAAMWAMFRRECAAARSEGYDGIRLVADMDWTLACPPSLPELARFELRVDEVAAELGATLVCAYRESSFEGPTIAEMVAVHQHTVGRASAAPGFRIWSAAAGAWGLSGEVDLSNADRFARALAFAADGRATLRLRASDLRFMGAAGINALVALAHSRPDLRVVIEGATPLFRHCWRLLELDRTLHTVEFAPAPAATGHPAAGVPAAEEVVP